MKKILTVFVLLGLVTILVVACGGGSNGGSSNSTVHMGDTNFAQSSITISKGSTITLTNDIAASHIIVNGSWVNGSVQPLQESGAPTLNHLQIIGKGASQTIGPFNSTGTFHLYCPAHPGMNLTVSVQ